MSDRRFRRRSFLARTAAAAAGPLVLRNPRSARGAPAADALGIAIVGAGGRGSWFVDTLPRMERVVALCDVNAQRAAQSFAKLPDAAKHRDFRVMLEKMHKDIDAVIVATPDHTHAVATAAALRAGKHVFCEKPLTRLVREARDIRARAKASRAATSMGNQGTASGQFRRAVELIRDGTLGEVRDVHVWKDSGGPNRRHAPEGEMPAPDHLAWDLWLGPNAARPFHPQWLSWGLWREFGTGNLGNWATHSANLAFMALKVDSLWHAGAPGDAHPVIRVQAATSGINRLSFPRWEVVRYEVPARAGFPPVTFTWHNGGGAPGSRDLIEGLMGDGLDWGDKKRKKWDDHAGALIVGSKGSIHATGHNAECRLLPAERFEDVRRDHPERLDRSYGHERDWLIACRGGKPAWAHFDTAGPLAEFLMLGNVATQFEGPLEFDPIACRILNNDDADRALGYEYREGWTL